MAVLRQVIPESLDQAGLDWRDFIEWRLGVESELIAARAEQEWLSLYDTAADDVRRIAYERFNLNASPRAYRVIDQYIGASGSGIPQLRVTVDEGETEQSQAETVRFNLVNGVWKRAS